MKEEGQHGYVLDKVKGERSKSCVMLGGFLSWKKPAVVSGVDRSVNVVDGSSLCLSANVDGRCRDPGISACVLLKQLWTTFDLF